MASDRRSRIIRYVKIDPKGCWIWQSTTDKAGYGRIKYKRKNQSAHRFSYETFIGLIPEGLGLDHLCRNTQCVNPKHLEPVTQKENVLRGNSFAAMNAQKTHCPQGHKYNGDNLVIQTKGGRVCRTCRDAYNKKNARPQLRIKRMKKKMEIKKLRKKGYSLRQIAKMVGIKDASTIVYHLKHDLKPV